MLQTAPSSKNIIFPSGNHHFRRSPGTCLSKGTGSAFKFQSVAPSTFQIAPCGWLCNYHVHSPMHFYKHLTCTSCGLRPRLRRCLDHVQHVKRSNCNATLQPWCTNLSYIKYTKILSSTEQSSWQCLTGQTTPNLRILQANTDRHNQTKPTRSQANVPTRQKQSISDQSRKVWAQPGHTKTETTELTSRANKKD